MSDRGYALSRFSGDKVAYRTKCFSGLVTKTAPVFDYKRDEIAVIQLLVGVLVSVILYGFFESGSISQVPCGICTVGWGCWLHNANINDSRDP